MYRLAFLLALVASLPLSAAQRHTPLAGSSFQPPIDNDISLAGNFGEPRPHHFHGGLDIRTEGVEGKHVRAIADGYVSRVTCGLYGFGNAVYITHPTGQTSVYCHLKSFSPRIKAALRRYQYRHKTSVADARLTPLDVPVAQGQFIALSGNTGHSTAPHLHLEIHDTRSWDMLDPYEYLSDFINDTVPPRAHGFMACPQDRFSRFNGGSGKQTFGFPAHELTTVFTAWGRVGFALWADDYMQGTYSHYGIRHTRLLVDGRQVFSSDVGRIPVAQNRLVNSWGDYDHWLSRHAWYMRSYVEPGNTLPILTADQRRGVVDFSEERDYRLEYILSDYKGNESHYTFTVKGTKPPQPTAPDHGRQTTANAAKTAGAADGDPAKNTPADAEKNAERTLFRWDRTKTYSLPGMQLVVPYGQLACNVELRPNVKAENRLDALSDVYTFSSRSLPLLSGASVSLSAQCPVADPTKLYVECGGRYAGGDYADGWVTGQTRDLALPCRLACDDEPPAVRPVAVNDYRRLIISAYDGKSGLASWTATVDGRFVVFDAIEKTSSFVCDLRETPIRRTGKPHTLKFTATDNRQNTRTLETTVVY